jgi:hypothetical protein
MPWKSAALGMCWLSLVPAHWRQPTVFSKALGRLESSRPSGRLSPFAVGAQEALIGSLNKNIAFYGCSRQELAHAFANRSEFPTLQGTRTRHGDLQPIGLAIQKQTFGHQPRPFLHRAICSLLSGDFRSPLSLSASQCLTLADKKRVQCAFWRSGSIGPSGPSKVWLTIHPK